VSAGIAIAVIGLLAVGYGIAQWQGRIRPGRNPHNIVERAYLLAIPYGAMLLLMAAVVVAAETGLAPDGLVMALFVVALFVVGPIGVVLIIWAPERLRPAWQRAQVADLAARHQRAEVASGRYGVDLVVAGRPFAQEGAGDDHVPGAVDRAQRLLDDQADASHALIVDVTTGEQIRTVEREP
jgi:hypothetical protein